LSAAAVEISHVDKIIRRRAILSDVSMTIYPGEVVGFIGPNGAGKTTLIRLLSGMSKPSVGEVRVNGRIVDGRSRMPQDIGLVLEGAGFVEHLSGRGNLLRLSRIRRRITPREVDETIRGCGLDPSDRRAVSKYSLGMRQRLGLAQALMERPHVLLLDEPTNGLDVVGIAELRTTIRRQADAGVAVFLASHLLSEVEQACDRVLMVREGRVVKEVFAADLSAGGGRIRVRFSTPAGFGLAGDRFEVHALDEPGVAGNLPAGPLAVIVTDFPVSEVVRRLVTAGIGIVEIGPMRVSLERDFLDQLGAAAK
jgi:ABC-2 type transport system ATP-binding protein